ncbi:MAG: family 20 glycosylhydrolase [Oscillospiraceae bacterium]|nr:family 20 glycosylhydrolase [Oscillospiraceae bacterium]
MKSFRDRRFLGGTAVVLVLAMIAGFLFLIPTKAADTSDMGSLADSFSANTSTFTLSDTSRFFIPTTDIPASDLVSTIQVAQQQFAADGYPSGSAMEIVWGKEDLIQAGDIVIRLDSSATAMGAEGYQLAVSSYATVTARDLRGVMYGLNALLKHFRLAGSDSIQGFTQVDTPDTTERTVSLDFARKYYSKDWICNFIRQMAWMGYNTIQLHLAEDSGIRMDIWDESIYKGSFQPANDLSWICGSEYAYYIDLFSPNGEVVDDPDKDRYLTAAEMIEILDTAKRYQISVIPSFDSPGHMDYLTWKYEDHYLKNTGYTFYSTYYDKTYAAKDVEGVINYTSSKSADITPVRYKPYFKAVDINNEQAKAFVMELYTDIGNFFKEYAGSTEFSICADEVVLSAVWTSSGWVEVDYNFDYSDFVGYINELNAHLNGMGYICRAYNDFIGITTYSDTYPLSSFPSNLKIMYWSSNHNAGDNGADGSQSTTCEPVSYFAGNRPLFNCLGNQTYYAQAYSSTTTHADCRCPQNTNWTMGYGTEDLIYDNWSPNDFTARGLYPSSTMTVDAEDVSGAYFLIWSDNPALSTESEIWNGFNSCNNDHLYVNLIDRMWSNSIKIWNWDINNTVTFDEFKALRAYLDDFPGLDSDQDSCTETNACSVAPTYVAATEAVCLADHDILSAALANKVSPDPYTAESYAVYQAAYDHVAAVDADQRATASQMSEAIAALTAAKNALVPKVYTVTVVQKLQNTDTTLATRSYEVGSTSGTFQLYLPRLYGYSLASTGSTLFTPLASADGSGYLSGLATDDTTITLWYRHSVDETHLQTLIAEAITDGTGYTAASWSAYQTALKEATEALGSFATQAEVDAKLHALEEARTALVMESSDTTLAVELLADSFLPGKQVGLYITTGTNISSITITDPNGEAVALTSCSGEIQTLDDGTTVKLWLVFFPAPDASTTYTVTTATASQTVTIQIA